MIILRCSWIFVFYPYPQSSWNSSSDLVFGKQNPLPLISTVCAFGKIFCILSSHVNLGISDSLKSKWMIPFICTWFTREFRINTPMSTSLHTTRSKAHLQTLQKRFPLENLKRINKINPKNQKNFMLFSCSNTLRTNRKRIQNRYTTSCCKLETPTPHNTNSVFKTACLVIDIETNAQIKQNSYFNTHIFICSLNIWVWFIRKLTCQ